MDALVFLAGDKELLPRVKPLWEKLNWHHLLNNTYFKHYYSTFTFETRQKHFLSESIVKLHVDLVCDRGRQRDVGYCVTSLNREGAGEIESLYIDADVRKLGLGDQLMRRAMAWLDEQGAVSRTISVAEGNEEVLPFYQRYGFYTRAVVLEYIPPQK